MTAPFPLPAHQTGRAGFPHPAFRLASSRGTRRRAEMDTPEVEHPKRAENRLVVEAVGAARRHLVTPGHEVTDAIMDVVVDRTIRGHASAVAEVRGPTPQQAIQPISYFGPCSHVSGNQEVTDLGLEPEYALLRRARPEIPMAILAIAVRAERVAKEVERLAAGIPNRGLRLVEREPQFGHHLPRPRQRLFRRPAAEDDEVIGIGDDPGLVGLAPSRCTPMLQEPVHVQIGEQWAYHPSLRRAAGTALTAS